MTSLHDEFFWSLERGWSVIPLIPKEKSSAIKWTEYQTRRADLETTEAWLADRPNSNLGIVTGAISGIFVLDIDGADGQYSIAQLGVLPQTPRVRTGKGYHYYFKHPGVPVITKAGILDHVDVRGDGGMVVGACSIHPSGAVYEWEITPEDCPLADAPDWLLELVLKPLDPEGPKEAIPIHRNGKSRGRDRAYALSALQREAEKVRRAPDGTKHDRLLNSAIAVAGFVPVLAPHEIETTLYHAIADRAADKHSARKTIRDGIRYGSQRPREIPEPTLFSRTPQPEPEDEGEAPPEEEINYTSLEDLLRDAPMTDAGNAECMAAIYPDNFRYCHTRGKWLLWDGTRWLVDANGEADRVSLEVVRERQRAALDILDIDKRKKALSYLFSAENVNKRRGLLSTAGILLNYATIIDQYDSDDWLCATPTGTLDLNTGQLREADRTDLITMRLGASFIQEAIAPRWRRFLSEVFGDDKELIAYVQRAIGYSLTGDTSEQKMFLCYGSGANGKSVFLEVLGWLLGDYAGNAAFDTFDAGRRSEATNDLAALKGKRLVTVIETDEDKRLAEARVKAVTGQDPITCRYLYCEPFTYRPTFKLWMAMNHKPIIRGTDRGIWRRVKLIPFTQNFEGREDKYLAETLYTELPGILNWALEGLAAWRALGDLGKSKAIEDATEEYRRESDLVAQWFEDKAASSPGELVLASDAYNSFKQWCVSFGYREPTQNGFARNLIEKGYQSVRDRGKRCYKGFILRDPDIEI